MADEVRTYDKGDSVNLDAIALTKLTVGSIKRGDTGLTLRSTTGYAVADVVLVAGAGPEGGDLIATVQGVNGNVLTLNTAAAETVTRTEVGKLTNPSSQVCTVERPNGTTVLPAVTVPSVGQLHAVYDIADDDPEGEYGWSYNTEGGARAYGEGRFNVRERRVG